MARIPLDHNEFLDFSMILLYDVLRSDNFLSGNKRFNKLKEKLIKKGIKNLLFDYYLKSPSEMRKEYKRFRNILKDDSIRPGTMFIYPNAESFIEEIKEILGKDVINEEKLMQKIEEINNE